jgi:hypothetical protein
MNQKFISIDGKPGTQPAQWACLVAIEFRAVEMLSHASQAGFGSLWRHDWRHKNSGGTPHRHAISASCLLKSLLFIVLMPCAIHLVKAMPIEVGGVRGHAALELRPERSKHDLASALAIENDTSGLNKVSRR